LLARTLAPDLALSSRERALLAYADRLTLAPATVRREDVAALRAAGLDDRGIHDACAIVAYFAFVNRIADGLGVELEAPAAGPGAAPAVADPGSDATGWAAPGA
jgi:uncharacterized peroxidase-related enzyme